MIVNNDSYVVKDAQGNPIADVQGKQVNVDPENIDNAFAQKTVDLFPDGKIVRKDKKVIYAATAGGNRSVESRSGGLGLTAMDDTGIMKLGTDTKEAQFNVSQGSLKLPNLKAGENFELQMTDSSAEEKSLVLKGVGTGSKDGATIVRKDNDLVFENIEIKEITLDGKDNKDGLDISDLEISLKGYQFKYEGGAEIRPEVIVKDKDRSLAPEKDYVAVYSNNKEKGTASVTVTGIGKYRGQRKINFIIADEAKNLHLVHFNTNGHGIKEVEDQLVEDGQPAVQPRNPMDNGWEFVGWSEEASENRAYNFKTPVTKDLILYGQWKSLGGDSPKLAVRFSDDPEDGQIVSVDGHKQDPWCVYTGDKVTPAVIVTFGAEVLKEGKDYTLSYSNNKNVTPQNRFATATINLKGDFKGKQTLNFVIRQKSIEDSDIEVDEMIAESGKKITPPGIYYGEYELTSKDFEISPKNAVAQKGSTVSLKGKGNFTGEIKNVSVNVISAQEKRDYKLSASLKLKENRIFNGERQTVSSDELIVKVKKDGYTPKEGKDYSVRYSNNLNAGTARVIVTGKGICNGKITKKFKISPEKTYKDYEVTVSGDGGHIYCVPDPASPEVKVTRKDGRTMTEGRDYTVKFSNNKNPGDSAKAKVTFTGNYKGTPAVTKPFKIDQAPFNGGMVSVSAASLVYLKPGKLNPEIVVTYGDTLLENKKDYTFKLFDESKQDITGKKQTFTDSQLPKTITVAATGKGRFDSTVSECSFVLRALPENSYDLTSAKILAQSTNKVLKTVDYTGKEVRPAIDVMAKKKGSSTYEIVPPAYYSVKYYNNVNRGKAKLVITGDNEKAFGSKAGQFTIGVNSFKPKDILTLIFELR